MILLLDISCGVLWSIAYIAAIVQGIKKRTWCIPRLSIYMNFSWELLVVISRLVNHETQSPAFYIQLIWCILDVGIILTWQLFRIRKRYTWLKDVACFLFIFSLVYLFAYKLGAWEFSVFIINVVMSAEFVARLNSDSTQWTSQLIATSKLLGTMAATVLNGLLLWNPFVLWLGGLCFLADSYYLFLLLNDRKGKKNEIS